MRTQGNHFVVSMVISLATLFELEGRTWTDLEGRQLDATIHAVEEQSVTVVREIDQRRFQLPLERLSEADRDYARAWASLHRDLKRRWPERVQAPPFEVKTLSSGDSDRDGLYRYASPHFRFECDAELSPRLVQHIASIFELVHAAGEAIPLMIEPRISHQTYSVRIFESADDYEAAGGLPGSAGRYSYTRNEVLVPLSSLAVSDQGGVYRPESNPDYPVLIHEIFHCITSEWKRYAPVWLVEGTARYMEVVPHTRNQLNFDGLTPRLAVWKSGNGAYRDVDLIEFEWILDCSYPLWERSFYDRPDQLRAQYTSAMVLTQYFLEFDGSGGARLKRYLFELSQGTNATTAREILLNGRSYEALTKDIVEAFRRERVTFRITEGN